MWYIVKKKVAKLYIPNQVQTVLGFEIGQRESGFYSERTKSQSHPVP